VASRVVLLPVHHKLMKSDKAHVNTSNNCKSSSSLCDAIQTESKLAVGCANCAERSEDLRVKSGHITYVCVW